MITTRMVSPHDCNDRLELDRFESGLCPHCGEKCYEILDKSDRRALTIPGKVDNGRCIACQGPAPTQSAGMGFNLAEEADVFDDDCEDPEAFAEGPSHSSQYDRRPSVSAFSASTDDNLQSLCSQNATVTRCMSELTSQPPISEKRCFQVLSYLYHISYKDPEKLASAMLLGGATAVSCAMASHRSSERVQMKACALLRLFAMGGEGYREQIYNAGGVPNIVACMMSFASGHKLLQQEALSAMYEITSLPRNADQFCMSQGTKLLQNIMRSYASDHTIQMFACGILYHVSLVQIDIIANPELIENIVKTLSKHKKAQEVIANGNKVFRVLAENGTQKTRNSMVWADVVPQIIKGMKYNFAFKDVVIEGCKALSALSAERREACVGVAEDGLGIIFDAMKKHDKSEEVQNAACDLLLYVSDGPTSSLLTKAIKKNSGKKILEAAKRSFPETCGQTAGTILNRCT